MSRIFNRLVLLRMLSLCFLLSLAVSDHEALPRSGTESFGVSVVGIEVVDKDSSDFEDVIALSNGLDLRIKVILEIKGSKGMLIPVLKYPSVPLLIRPLGFRLRRKPDNSVVWSYLWLRCSDSLSSPGLSVLKDSKSEIEWVKLAEGTVLQWTDYHSSGNKKDRIGVSVFLKRTEKTEPREVFSNFANVPDKTPMLVPCEQIK